MGNPIPSTPSQVIALATNMDQGLITLGTELKITQITPAEMQSELNAFIAVDGEFNAARSAKQAASDLFKPTDEALTERLQATRNVLAGRFGSRWSTMWAQAGFINASTQVPRPIEERLGLALNLTNFFIANPSYEVASMGITAADLTTLRNTALTTRQAYTAADVALKSKGDAWDTAFATLTGTMRSLVKILEATLEDNDPRWLTFGLQMPSMITTPAKPLDLTATLDETGALLVLQCGRVALATRYRWRMRYVGIESDFRLVGRSADAMIMLDVVRPGQTVEFIVQAVNDDRQSVASDPVTFTMPVAKATAERRTVAGAVEASPLESIVVAPERNGSNGHSNGSRLPALA